MNRDFIDVFKNDSFADLLAIKLIDCQLGYAKAQVTVTDELLNFHGFAHGGLIFSLADYVFAIASNSYGQTAVGLNAHASFLKPAKVGDLLICTAREVKRTTKIAVYEMKTTLETGELIATTEGMVYITNRPLRLDE
ncbi:MAG TPA: hotdog fold thioesterase [Bacillota bacterium]